MSIYSAMQTGVAGLRANASAVSTISSNIANANTDGYRRSFAQMVTTGSSAAGGRDFAASGVRAVEGTDMTTAGVLRATGNATDLALEGSGFFVVSRSPNDPLESNYMLTRAGSFVPDENGNLRNAAGFYLAGYPLGEGGIGTVDPNSFSGLATVNVGAQEVLGRPTTTMGLSGNLPAQETGSATPGDPFATTAEYYTALGGAENVGISWQPTATANRWTLTLTGEGGAAYGSVTVDFSDSGPTAGAPAAWSDVTDLSTAPAGFAFDTATGIATLTIDNGGTPQEITLSLGAPGSFDGMTQFAGDYAPGTPAVDGAEAGRLQRTEIGDDGTVFGVFDNGTRSALFRIPVAEVANPAGLIAGDGNAFLLSRASGAFSLSEAGTGSAGRIASGATESSNVDIAQELTDLISTQRAYSTNAKIVTTADEMLDETTRLKR